MPDLKYSDGTLSGAGLSVSNGPGHWASGSVADLMYASYDYNQYQDVTVQITNLVAGTDYGTLATLIGPG